MGLPPIPAAVIRHYEEDYAESDRLDAPHGTVEFLRTCELLERHLPGPPGMVIDVGGGPGRYASWLVDNGYEVSLVDPVERHVAAAAQIDGVLAVQGDARALPFDNDTAAATLVLGPLYHLDSHDGRVRALAEARRVTRSGGLVVAAAISRYAALIDYASRGDLAEGDQRVEAVAAIRRGGWFDVSPLGFTHAFFFHRHTDLVDEMAEAGIRGARLYGVEGPAAASLLVGSDEERMARVPSVIVAARLAETDPDVIAVSQHFLAIAQIP